MLKKESRQKVRWRADGAGLRDKPSWACKQTMCQTESHWVAGFISLILSRVFPLIWNKLSKILKSLSLFFHCMNWELLRCYQVLPFNRLGRSGCSLKLGKVYERSLRLIILNLAVEDYSSVNQQTPHFKFSCLATELDTLFWRTMIHTDVWLQTDDDLYPDHFYAIKNILVVTGTPGVFEYKYLLIGLLVHKFCKGGKEQQTTEIDPEGEFQRFYGF